MGSMQTESIYKHKEFIKTPISILLEEAVTACSTLGNGIETQPLKEYVLQTLFIKMTGFQEQKCKCIVWDFATNDFDFRFEFLKKSSHGISSFTEVDSVFKVLVDQLRKNNFDLADYFNMNFKKRLILHSVCSIVKIFRDTNIQFLDEVQFKTFKRSVMTLGFEAIAPCFLKKSGEDNWILFNSSGLKEKELFLLYKALFNHRNRCAHNTLLIKMTLFWQPICFQERSPFLTIIF